ncbi:MAG: STAS domain-containing protein [Oligoflexia bacterium]|nr:STAS domain-containing protein [Oligoflexia bacterium]
MKTQFKKSGDAIIVSMDGKLDFETNLPLRDDLAKLLRGAEADVAKKAHTDSAPKKIIFNLEKLEFVGSSGISSFVQTLKDFNTSAPVKPVYCNVKSEFKRVIKAFDDADAFEFYDNEDRARKSYDQ